MTSCSYRKRLLFLPRKSAVTLYISVPPTVNSTLFLVSPVYVLSSHRPPVWLFVYPPLSLSLSPQTSPRLAFVCPGLAPKTCLDMNVFFQPDILPFAFSSLIPVFCLHPCPLATCNPSSYVTLIKLLWDSYFFLFTGDGELRCLVALRKKSSDQRKAVIEYRFCCQQGCVWHVDGFYVGTTGRDISKLSIFRHPHNVLCYTSAGL